MGVESRAFEPHTTGCPWWSREQLIARLGEERTIRDLAARWGVGESTLRDWIDRHELSDYDRLPALGRDVVSVLEQAAAEGPKFLTARDIATDSDIPESASRVGAYVSPAGDAIGGVAVERYSESDDRILWRVSVDSPGGSR